MDGEKLTIGNCAFSYLWPALGGIPQVYFHRTTRPVLPWREELGRAAETIANSTKRPLWLALSGGIDSEVMAEVFFEKNIPFRAFSVRHIDGGNRHDIYYAQKWCDKRGIKLETLDIDFVKFLDNVAVAESQKVEFSRMRVFRHFQIWLLQQIEARGGLAVLGGGEQLYRLSLNEPIECSLWYFRDVLSALEVARRMGQPHVPYFHLATPELAASFQEIEIVRTCLAQPRYFKNPWNSMAFKRFVYHSEFPEMELREKFDGFEKHRKVVVEANLRYFGVHAAVPHHEISVREMRRQFFPA